MLKAGVQKTQQEIEPELIRMVRQKIGPIASFKAAAVVKRLPKTRSGKILRGTIKKIADGVAYTVPATIDDPAILDEIAETPARHGISPTLEGSTCHDRWEKIGRAPTAPYPQVTMQPMILIPHPPFDFSLSAAIFSGR